jgi:YbgC/YbaW family acyl-CoA thioester hydrolase
MPADVKHPRPFLAYDRVRWADVDLVAIMRFSAFTRLVELAEQEMLREAGLSYATIFDAPEIYMPRRHFSVEYFAPARLDDELALVTYVSRLGETSLTLNVDVRSRTRWTLVASAAMVVVCVTAATFAKRPLPRIVRTALAPYLLSPDEARAWSPLAPER